jgi:hypothetical protein
MGAGVSRVGNSYRSASQTKTQDEVAYPEKNASAKWKIMPSSDEARYDDYDTDLVSNLNFFHVKKTLSSFSDLSFMPMGL